MSLIIHRITKTLFGAKDLAPRWGICLSTIKIRMLSGDIKTIRFGSRRLVPLEEVQRIDREGIGRPVALSPIKAEKAEVV